MHSSKRIFTPELLRAVRFCCVPEQRLRPRAAPSEIPPARRCLPNARRTILPARASGDCRSRRQDSGCRGPVHKNRGAVPARISAPLNTTRGSEARALETLSDGVSNSTVPGIRPGVAPTRREPSKRYAIRIVRADRAGLPQAQATLLRRVCFRGSTACPFSHTRKQTTRTGQSRGMRVDDDRCGARTPGSIFSQILLPAASRQPVHRAHAAGSRSQARPGRSCRSTRSREPSARRSRCP